MMSAVSGNQQDGADGRTEKPEIFRTTGWLRYSVLIAICFWVAMFFFLVALHTPVDRGFLGVGFFIALFTVLAVFYNNTSIEVTGDSLIMRGVLSFRLVFFDDILKVDVTPGLLQTTYAVRARRGFVSFTSVIADHQRLLRVIVERARLAPA
jgi:hypothetical protein